MKFSFFFRILFSALYILTVLYSQPKIQLNKTKIELGTIYQGDIKTIHLVVSNTGNQPLVISRIETSCGCTSAKSSIPTIVPGASDTITVSFNSAGFDGKITKSVTIQSNDPSKPFVDAMFTGNVTAELELVPKMQIVNLGAAIVGSKSTVTVLLRNNSQEPLTIKGVSFADTNVTVQLPTKQIAPSDTAKIAVTYIPRSTLLINNLFYVETSSPRQPRIPFRYMYSGR